jgi:Mn-containing catalase
MSKESILQRHAAHQRKYYAAHRELCNEQSRRYKLAHREEIKEQHMKYRAANHDKINEQRRQQWVIRTKLMSEKPCLPTISRMLCCGTNVITSV